MHKRILNELTLTFDINPYEAPLLIKSGLEGGADPTLPDMSFVRSTHPQTGRPTVFLPGSSLKGTMRAYCERIARTVKPDADSGWCCNPFHDTFCGKLTENEECAVNRYAKACVICRIFGNTRLGSHLRISDAYPMGKVKLEQRDGVAIDRVSGAVAAGPFNLEVVTQGAFRTTLTLRNFQLWQIGLLAIAMRDISRGMVPIGYGKSKGFGRVSLSYQNLTIIYPGQWQTTTQQRNFAQYIYDLSAFGFEEKSHYALLAAKDPLDLPVTSKIVDDGTLGQVGVAVENHNTIEQTLLSAVPAWRTAVETVGWIGRME